MSGNEGVKVKGRVKVRGSATERSKIDCLKGSLQGEFTNQITQSTAVGGMRKSNCKLARRASELGGELVKFAQIGWGERVKK
jgi:hypothetical protein